jgi:uncharacterized iron-regulated protein
MIKKTTLLLALFSLYVSTRLCAIDKPAYTIFNSEGKEVDYDQMVKSLKKNQVIFFGELHNNPIAHWLQLEMTMSLYEEKKQDLILAAEMFEADDQLIVNEYLKGKITDKTFNDEAKLWSNYSTDYKPLMDFAKNKGLAFICANIPRRYANLVYKSGIATLDSLDNEAKKYIAPLPMPYDTSLACYKEIVANAGGHGGENLPKSQAIKDATMAWFIYKSLDAVKQVLHFNGSYHSDHEEGIAWYLKQYMPSVTIGSISTKEQTDIKKLAEENKGMADFIIVIPENMTKTY